MKYNKIILTGILALSLNLNANETQTQEPSMINQAKHNAKEMIQTAKEKIDSLTIEEVKNTATTTWEKTKTNLNEISENNTSKYLINKASTSIESFKEYINVDSNNSTLKKVKEFGKDVKQYSKEKYQELTK